jgi:hypothetical protein
MAHRHIKLPHNIIGGTKMSNAPAQNTNNASENRPIVLKEIQAKWSKFSEQEVSAFRNRDDVVKQVEAKYSLDKAQAQRDVDALLKGRQF